MGIKNTIHKKFLKVAEQRDALSEEVKQLREKLASYQRRDRAEEVLIQARESDACPPGLRADTVDGFLSKRANLEDKPLEGIDKIATMLEWWGEGDAMEVAELDDGSTDDLTGWLRSQA